MILCPLIRQRYFDSNGLPLAGGKLYSYAAGTTTPQATYTDQGGLTPNTNPVILDSSGKASVWLDPTLAYKFVVADASDVVQDTVDQVSGAGGTGIGGWNATTNYSAGDILADASGSGMLYVSLTDNNVGNALTDVANWRVFGGKVRTIAANTSLAVTDELILSDSTVGALTHTFPVCSTTPIGKRITIKDIGTGGNTTSVKGAGTDNVDGANTYGTALIKYQSATFENNGSAWYALGIPADLSISTAKLAANSVTPAKMAALNYALSASSGAFTSNSATYVDVTNLSVSLTTAGRPVRLMLVSDSEGSLSCAYKYFVACIRDTSTTVGSCEMGNDSNAEVVFSAPSACEFFDPVAAGTHTYKIQVKTLSAVFANVTNMKLLAYEM